MAKPRMFIGSSGEGAAAGRVFAHLVSDTVDPRHWARGSEPSETIIEYLERAAREVDLAALLVTADDFVRTRGEEFSVPRDNVIFELGFFMGALGRRNTFIIMPNRADLKLPSDLGGVIQLRYADDTGSSRDQLRGPALALQAHVIEQEELSRPTATSLPPLATTLTDASHLANTVRAELIENGSNRFELFALAAGGAVMHAYEQTPHGPWSPWSNYQGVRSAVDISAILYDQRLLVGVLSESGELITYRQVNRLGTWGRPKARANDMKVGARLLATSPAQVISVNADGSVVIAPLHPDGDEPLDLAEVIGPLPMAASIRALEATTGLDGTAHVIARDENGLIWHARQVPDVTDRRWTEWRQVCELDPEGRLWHTVAPDGRIVLAGMGDQGILELRLLRHPDGTNWTEVAGLTDTNMQERSGVTSIAFRCSPDQTRLYAATTTGQTRLITVDHATTTGTLETIDVRGVRSLVSSKTALAGEPILVGFADKVEVRRA